MLAAAIYLLALGVLPVLGCALLAAAQRLPRASIFGRGAGPAPRTRALLTAGYLCLALSAALFLCLQPAEFVVLLWPLALSVGAGTVAMTLAYEPRALAALARAFTHRDEAAENGDAS
ncbi:MAG: DUF3325 family protein [Pseudomonadota bacterium]